jgi:hypothetical protein
VCEIRFPGAAVHVLVAIGIVASLRVMPCEGNNIDNALESL